MLMANILLIGAIISEVFGSTMLKLSQGFKKIIPTILFVAGYAGALIGSSLALEVLELGIVYAIWSGVGTALTVIVGIAYFKERASKNVVVGVLLIIVGVVLLNIEKVFT